MTQISALLQDLNPDNLIELFQLDTTNAGGGSIYYFFQGSANNAPISFGGTEYQPLDCEFEGMEVSGTSALPTPVIRIANAGGLPQALINTYGDLVGCQVRRIRTFKRYLDDGAEPDGGAFIGPDIFRVERKSSENPVYIEWELSAAADQQGMLIPGRVVIRDTCLWRYRRWTGTTFDYSKVECPYTGNQYFDEDDQPTTPDKDRPSRTINCCRVRFGANKPLPFGGFPGVARSRF